MEEKFKLIKKVKIIDTLLTLPVGESVEIKAKDIKMNALRSGVRQLNNKGYLYESTESGRFDRVLVTRKR